MDSNQERTWLIRALLEESRDYGDLPVPRGEDDQRRLLRSLMNVRLPAPISGEFARVQDDYLRGINARRGIVTPEDIGDRWGNLYLWQGDITRLQVGAIVNAANSGMTGCYRPCHNCIDNCIHTYAGIQLRLKCDEIMRAQGHEEPTGQAKITPAYNLPCKYVIHTVGPIVEGRLTKKHEDLLASCYRSCLELAEENGVESIAFCCISTGVFGFPKQRAAEIAVETVQEYFGRTGSWIKVIFNVFKDEDLEIYQKIINKENN